MKITRFEDIDSWKEARILVNKIFEITDGDFHSKGFALKSQIQRAAISVSCNIAEGFDGGSPKSFINFLKYSYRSASEVQSLLYIFLDQQYIDKQKFDELYEHCDKTKNLIGGFIKYLKTQI
ncbi:four helix bundle protein [Bacteroidota bacterium]